VTLFAAAALTVFLPYFGVERLPNISTGAPSHTYRFTGLDLLSGSYGADGRDVAFYAADGAWLPYMILTFVFLGLVTTPSRRHRALTWGLGALAIIALIGGCASTSDSFDFFGGGWAKHIEAGFLLAVLFLVAAGAIRFFLWRMPIPTRNPQASAPSAG
jgi:hypothetical protein